MFVVGIDLSSHAIDIVRVPLAEHALDRADWSRFKLTGADAFDRTRGVRDAMPSRTSVFWDDVMAIGIEHPAGHHGAMPLLRIQGAILSCLPPHLLVHPLPPAAWKKTAGLKGNATKDEVAALSLEIVRRAEQSGEPWRTYVVKNASEWPQDAHDAHLIARATRTLVRQYPVAA